MKPEGSSSCSSIGRIALIISSWNFRTQKFGQHIYQDLHTIIPVVVVQTQSERCYVHLLGIHKLSKLLAPCRDIWIIVRGLDTFEISYEVGLPLDLISGLRRSDLKPCLIGSFFTTLTRSKFKMSWWSSLRNRAICLLSRTRAAASGISRWKNARSSTFIAWLTGGRNISADWLSERAAVMTLMVFLQRPTVPFVCLNHTLLGWTVVVGWRFEWLRQFQWHYTGPGSIKNYPIYRWLLISLIYWSGWSTKTSSG